MKSRVTKTEDHPLARWARLYAKHLPLSEFQALKRLAPKQGDELDREVTEFLRDPSWYESLTPDQKAINFLSWLNDKTGLTTTWQFNLETGELIEFYPKKEANMPPQAKKLTVIFKKEIMPGDEQVIVKRIIEKPGESLQAALDREKITGVAFTFQGWPRQYDEPEVQA